MKVEIKNINFIDVNYLASDECKQRIKESSGFKEIWEHYNKMKLEETKGTKLDIYA